MAGAAANRRSDAWVYHGAMGTSEEGAYWAVVLGGDDSDIRTIVSGGLGEEGEGGQADRRRLAHDGTRAELE